MGKIWAVLDSRSGRWMERLLMLSLIVAVPLAVSVGLVLRASASPWVRWSLVVLGLIGSIGGVLYSRARWSTPPAWATSVVRRVEADFSARRR